MLLGLDGPFSQSATMGESDFWGGRGGREEKGKRREQHANNFLVRALVQYNIATKNISPSCLFSWAFFVWKKEEGTFSFDPSKNPFDKRS